MLMQEEHILYIHQTALPGQVSSQTRCREDLWVAITTSATASNKEFMIRAPKNDSIVGAPAHQAAVAKEITISQKSTGKRPKKVDSMAAISPPPARLNVAPTREWLTVSTEVCQ